jgi:hypothetical protein
MALALLTGGRVFLSAPITLPVVVAVDGGV